MMSRSVKQPYSGSKRFDVTCRNHGACPHCRKNRTFSRLQQIREPLDKFAVSETDSYGGIIDCIADFGEEDEK